MASAPTNSLRRTQPERRAETRAKLLDATIRSLLDVGYARTTTRRVTALAGVSQGAQTHHFSSRTELVCAAVERLFSERIDTLRRRASRLPDDPDARARAVLELVWSDFSSDLFRIVVKIWVAAADDPELYNRLVPMEAKMAQEITRTITHLVDHDETQAQPARAQLTVALAAIRGLALSIAYEPTANPPRDPWPSVRPVLERLLIAQA